jgi:hypothetical protein
MRLTKKENVDEIIYTLKMSGTADFEVDEYESFSIIRLENGQYALKSQIRYMEVKNITEARKTINKLGKNILWM